MRLTLLRFAVPLLVVPLLLVACGDDSGSSPTATLEDVRPVDVAEQPAAGFSLGDPGLEPLPGASVDIGRYKGAIYQIEIPDNWNHRLVMYIHGNDLDTTLQAYPPPFRSWLVNRGYAWATSSFSVNIHYVNGVAADETAALWEYFVQKHGHPDRTYVTGISMGGAAAFTSAERYADRYDGALALCGDAPPKDWEGDLGVIAAYAAGVTQEEFDQLGPEAVLQDRILPALEDDAVFSRFADLWIARSGGPRVFGLEGLREAPDLIWEYALSATAYSNEDKVYDFTPPEGVSIDDFNRDVVRVSAQEPPDRYFEGNSVSGDIKMPLIAMQGTGDVESPFSELQVYARRVADAGKEDLFVSRVIRDPRHCGNFGITTAEIGQALEDLVVWVEEGVKADGEDVLGDLTDAGERFTLAPRYGSPEAEEVAGAGDRVTVRGTATIDGEPIEGNYLWASVQKGGLSMECSYRYPKVVEGGYEIAIAAAGEAPGCGEPGAMIYLWYYDGDYYVAQEALDWPEGTSEVAFDAVFARETPGGAYGRATAEYGSCGCYGELRAKDGAPAPVGTTVEAYVGDVLCGRFTTPPVVMVFYVPGRYGLASGDDPACLEGDTVSFKVNGTLVDATIPNRMDPDGYSVDLVIP